MRCFLKTTFSHQATIGSTAEVISGARVGGGTGGSGTPAGNASFFSAFPDVCPEPVLAN